VSLTNTATGENIVVITSTTRCLWQKLPPKIFLLRLHQLTVSGQYRHGINTSQFLHLPPVVWQTLPPKIICYSNYVTYNDVTTYNWWRPLPEILASLRTRVVELFAERLHECLHVSVLQRRPHSLVLVLVEGVKVHPQRAREQHRVLWRRGEGVRDGRRQTQRVRDGSSDHRRMQQRDTSLLCRWYLFDIVLNLFCCVPISTAVQCIHN